MPIFFPLRNSFSWGLDQPADFLCGNDTVAVICAERRSQKLSYAVGYSAVGTRRPGTMATRFWHISHLTIFTRGTMTTTLLLAPLLGFFDLPKVLPDYQIFIFWHISFFNHIPTRGAGYAHLITTCSPSPPDFQTFLRP